MKYVMPRRLVDFLDMMPTRILLIESENYIEKLLTKYPFCEIFFVTADMYKLQDAVKEYENKISYAPLAFNQTKLPFGEGFFDVIMGDELFAENFNPQDIASGLGMFLKPTGFLLTSFSNLLFAPWLEKLTKDERSEFIVRRGYTKEDFERLMVASFYKEIFFEPLGAEEGDEPPFYAAKAYTSVFPVRNLKSMYNDSVRKELSRLLHRIEYKVFDEEALKSLQKLTVKEKIFDDYIEDFINETCFDRDYVLKVWKKRR